MINIIGRGNVAFHLHKAFEGKEDVKIINPHTLENLDNDADLILICVSDNAIVEVAEKLKGLKTLVAHTAGSVSINVLKDITENYGVFYPLQTFTRGVELKYLDIPFFIEASSPEALSKLNYYASLISDQIIEIDSEKRKYLHLASVFVCNFTNALAGVSEVILKEADMDYKVILPLMKQTVDKLYSLSPTIAQTGPAARKDTTVMEMHMKILETWPQLRDLYKTFSNLILTQYES